MSLSRNFDPKDAITGDLYFFPINTKNTINSENIPTCVIETSKKTFKPRTVTLVATYITLISKSYAMYRERKGKNERK